MEELQQLRQPKITDYNSRGDNTIPLHLRVDHIMKQREATKAKTKAKVDLDLKARLATQGLKTEDEILEELRQKEAEARERIRLTEQDIEQKYQKTMTHQRHKQQQAQSKKAELEIQNCTFKPDINRKKSGANIDGRKSVVQLEASPDAMITVPNSARVEDRLLEKGMKAKERKDSYLNAPLNSFQPSLN